MPAALMSGIVLLVAAAVIAVAFWVWMLHSRIGDLQRASRGRADATLERSMRSSNRAADSEDTSFLRDEVQRLRAEVRRHGEIIVEVQSDIERIRDKERRTSDTSMAGGARTEARRATEWRAPPPSAEQPRDASSRSQRLEAAKDELARPASESSAAPVDDLAAARRAFAAWCRSHAFPDGDGSLERAAMRVVVSDPENQGMTPRVLGDTPQVAEFARIGRAAAQEGFLFPNPESHFTPIVPKLFPGIDASWDQTSATYERLTPLRIRRRADGNWEIV